MKKKKEGTKAEQVHRDYLAGAERLDDREKDIIERYYGFNGHMRHSLEEIAEGYKITRERIRQIKHHAVEKIKRP